MESPVNRPSCDGTEITGLLPFSSEKKEKRLFHFDKNAGQKIFERLSAILREKK